MKRIYEDILREHLVENRQMAFVVGPRQVGKTTTSSACIHEHKYYTWDRQSDRRLLTAGADAVAEDLGLSDIMERPRSVVFDELHKYRHWKSLLKGFFDVYGDRTRMIVTGSARLGVFRRGGDSLMGRYFLYRMHPLSVAELVRTTLPESPIALPVKPAADSLEGLYRFGGFPEPFTRGSVRFYNRWRRLRNELLFREDLRDLTQIHEVGQVEVLADLLADRVGQLVNFSSLAADVGVSVDTVRRWVRALEALFYCFTIRPWFQNVPKSLRKQPKVFLWDWSLVEDGGARIENLVASHLLKATQFWTDMGFGTFELRYIRDKMQREVDFLVVRDAKPFFMVEAKRSGDRQISSSLLYFHNRLRINHAFQVAFNMDYVERDCFDVNIPVRVPASTFLSQLV